jgi:hypothetical protein
VHLVKDPTKRWSEGQNGFVDFLIGNSRRRDGISNSVFIMELKSVPLRSLWKAQQPYPNAEPPSNNCYQPIVNELVDASEHQLLALKYSYYDYKDRQWHTQEVKNTLQIATDQLSEYLGIVSLGQATPTGPGVADPRVICQGGQDVLWGYIIICVGGARVICKQTMKVPTKYSYEIFREPQT